MTKALEALNVIKACDEHPERHEKEYELIEKALKAFEILKKYAYSYTHDSHKNWGIQWWEMTKVENEIVYEALRDKNKEEIKR